MIGSSARLPGSAVTPTGVLAMGRVNREQTDSAGAIKLGVTKEWWVSGDWGIVYNRTLRHSHLGGLSPEQFESAQKPR